MLIRRADNNDIEGIQKLLRQVLMVHHNGRPDIFKGGVQKYTKEELTDILKDDSKPVYVAINEEGKVIGHAFCIYQRHIASNIMTDIKTMYIDDICVDENERGRHVGKNIYEYVIDCAKSEGCYNVTLNVWSCNETALRFYESCGMKQQKIGMETIL